ncbi:MAG: peptidase [Bacteroidota bacterium]
MIFLDGVGLGSPSPVNPLSTQDLPSLRRLGKGASWTADLEEQSTRRHVIRRIDATLGVEGLPQSGTGQASLFTGVNCAAIAARHYGPFPHSTSRPVIAAQNVYMRLQAAGVSTRDLCFANAYPDRFFSYIRATNRWTVTTLCCHTAGVPLLERDDLAAGRAVAANLTGEGWPGDPAIPRTNEKAAASALVSLALANRFTLFEYYLTDKAGHGRPGAPPDVILDSLDRFLQAVMTSLPDDIVLLVTSDHGNLEDVSTRGHTRNEVPFVAYGPSADAFAGVRSLLDVTPTIVTYLTEYKVT